MSSSRRRARLASPSPMPRARPGVSAAAPYRHFRDREALLADVAREGFQRFEAMLSTGWARRQARRASPPSTISARPTSPSPAPSPPTTPPCSDRACRPTSTPICARRPIAPLACCAAPPTCWLALLPAGKRPPALMMSLHVWAMAHGIASLFGRGDAGRRTPADDGRGAAGIANAHLPAGAGFPPKKSERPLTPQARMPNVNVVNIYIR